MTLAPDRGQQQADIGALGGAGELAGRCQRVLDEAGLEEQVLGEIAGEKELGQQQDIGLGGDLARGTSGCEDAATISRSPRQGQAARKARSLDQNL
jgi:hypothetical protein